MAILLKQLIDLVRAGSSASVDSRDYIAADLLGLVKIAPPKAMLVIRNAEQMTPDQRIDIARAAACQVLFEL